MRIHPPIEKDIILRDLYQGVHVSHNSSDFQEVLDILIADGYIEVISFADGNFNKLTDKGKGFILNGGYTEQERIQKKEFRFSLMINAINWTIAIIASIISAILGFIIGHMTK